MERASVNIETYVLGRKDGALGPEEVSSILSLEDTYTHTNTHTQKGHVCFCVCMCVCPTVLLGQGQQHDPYSFNTSDLGIFVWNPLPQVSARPPPHCRQVLLTSGHP